jgi:hypothetical protein
MEIAFSLLILRQALQPINSCFHEHHVCYGNSAKITALQAGGTKSVRDVFADFADTLPERIYAGKKRRV